MKVPSLKEGVPAMRPSPKQPCQYSNLTQAWQSILLVRCCEQPAASSWADSTGYTRQGQSQSQCWKGWKAPLEIICFNYCSSKVNNGISVDIGYL